MACGVGLLDVQGTYDNCLVIVLVVDMPDPSQSDGNGRELIGH
jgi:hypothetical protein